ncbi:MAG: hypothetical protein ACPG32_00205 [Akkermansiaceae bacterium]
MDTKNEVEAVSAAVVCDISRHLKQGFMFVGASIVVGSLILGGSLTDHKGLEMVLFILAGAIVSIWAVYTVFKFFIRLAAARKRTRESIQLEQAVSGRMTISKKGIVSTTKDVGNNPIAARSLS